MIKSKLRTAERLRDTWALKAPQVFPMTGDGPLARAAALPLRRGEPDSFLGRNKRGQWDSISLKPTREMLVEARFRDWLASRDQGRIAA